MTKFNMAIPASSRPGDTHLDVRGVGADPEEVMESVDRLVRPDEYGQDLFIVECTGALFMMAARNGGRMMLRMSDAETTDA